MGLADFIGDVETRFSERGCNGLMGIELDRRMAFRVADLTRPPSSCFLEAAWAAGFAASPSAFRAELTTCVAKAALSRSDNPSLFPSPVIFVVLAFAAPEMVCFADLPVLVCRLPAGTELLQEFASSFGSNSPLRVTIVAAEQVEILETALLTASASERREAMYY
jgi:hypothetical protein